MPTPCHVLSIPYRRPWFTSYSGNSPTISRLERSAEELSQSGSDLGAEIRKLSELERSHQCQEAGVNGERGRSSAPHADLAVNVNVNVNHSPGQPRWGEYALHQINSPTASVRSGSSWTHISINRWASGRSSQFAQMAEPPLEDGPSDTHSPPAATDGASMQFQEQQTHRHASQSSFAHHYDAIANQIEESLQAVPPTTSTHPERDGHHRLPKIDVPDRPESTDTFQEAQIAFKDFDGVHFSPETEEYVELDQDGHEIRRVSARNSSGLLIDAASVLREPKGRPMSYAVPPPNPNMVYYPAPVPRMLNLPKRLSKLPAANVQARRSQMLNDMPQAARQSAHWIPPIAFTEDEGDLRSVKSKEAVRSHRSGSESDSAPASHQEAPRSSYNERMSVANMQHLPPQLRASMYFDHQSISQDIEIRGESAVATLDSILAASATAPVNVFTDHPYAGDVRKSVYAMEKPHHRKNTSTNLTNASSENESSKGQRFNKKRSSSIGKLFRRSSTDVDGLIREESRSRPTSRGSMLDMNAEGNKVRRRKSQLSLGDELESTEKTSGTPGHEATPDLKRQSSGLLGRGLNADSTGSRPISTYSRPLDDELLDGKLDNEDDEDFYEDTNFVQPSTLLAELQVRKAQLKSRNKTAATAFPGGMHSTLLQLDAVEQIYAKNRQRQRVALAWEDPEIYAREEARREQADEDIPLAVLFPSRDGLINKKKGDGKDWGRQLGLMEKRELEDNEPLSNRRTRLNPSAIPLKKMSQMHLAGQPDMPSEEQAEDDDGETLGQRVHRLKTRAALDAALSDVVPKNNERPLSTFSADVLNQLPEFGKPDQHQDKPGPTDLHTSQVDAGVQEEETLGQRRVRLQREREASGVAGQDGEATRPTWRQSQSMTDVLATDPTAQRPGKGTDPYQAIRGTLLHTSSQAQLKAKQDLQRVNMRSSSYGLERPLVDSRSNKISNVPVGLLAEHKSRPANGAFAGGMYNGTEGNAANGAYTAGRSNLINAQRSRPANGAFANGMYNNMLPQAASTPMLNMYMNMGNSSNPYFASPTAGMAMGAGGYAKYPATNMMGGYQQQQQPMMNGQAYLALSGGHGSTMMPPGNPMMGMGTYAAGLQQQMGVAAGAGMPMQDPSLEPSQRAAIDRWRMGVAQ